MNAPVKELTAAQITAAITKAKKRTKKSETGKRPVTRTAATVNKALAALRRVLEAAIAQKLATFNAAKLCRTLDTDDSTLRAPFTVTEIRAMLDHKETSDEWKGAITIAAHTGLRLSDVLSLSTKNVDGTRLVIMPSKTAKSKKVITVPLTPACIQWIGKKKGDFFPKLKEQKTAVSSTQFTRIMEKAKVPKEIELAGGIKASRSFHALRHTFASLLAEADVHSDIRQKLTGHSSSKIHQRYTHHDEALDRAVGTLPAL
jgi:integrase